jgi:GNAT acetyltransferase-like protein
VTGSLFAVHRDIPDRRAARADAVIAPDPRLTFRDYEYRAIPGDVWEAWDRSGPEWQRYPFESTAWLRAVAGLLPVDASPRLLVARGPDDSIVAFWPYALQRFRSGGVLPVILCRPWDANVRTAGWITVSPALDGDACGAILDGFEARVDPWDKMLTGLVPDPSPLLDAVVDRARRTRRPLEREVHTFAEIKGWESFDGFLDSLSHDWRRKYRRLTSKMSESGVGVQQFDGERAQRAVNDIKQRALAIYRESWKTRSGDRAANLMCAETSRHFCALLDGFARRGGLHAIFVTVEGDDAAFYVGLRSGDVYCSLQTAYKECYASRSVGFLAQLADFRYTVEQGLATNNLLANQDYKGHFTKSAVAFSSFVLFGGRPRARAARALSALKARLGAVRPDTVERWLSRIRRGRGAER